KALDQVLLALTQRLSGDRRAAKVTAEKARETIEQLYRNQPKDPVSQAAIAAVLSQAYAAMGEKDLALKGAERAVILCPPAKDAVTHGSLEGNLALIQTIFGENGRAISTLTQLLQT